LNYALKILRFGITPELTQHTCNIHQTVTFMSYWSVNMPIQINK